MFVWPKNFIEQFSIKNFIPSILHSSQIADIATLFTLNQNHFLGWRKSVENIRKMGNNAKKTNSLILYLPIFQFVIGGDCENKNRWTRKKPSIPRPINSKFFFEFLFLFSDKNHARKEIEFGSGNYCFAQLKEVFCSHVNYSINRFLKCVGRNLYLESKQWMNFKVLFDDIRDTKHAPKSIQIVNYVFSMRYKFISEWNPLEIISQCFQLTEYLLIVKLDSLNNMKFQ